MNKIFIIIGETGEYSDRQDWFIAWTSSEDVAKFYVTRLTNKAKQFDWGDFNDYRPRLQEFCRFMFELDQEMGDRLSSIGFNDVRYYYRSVDKL